MLNNAMQYFNYTISYINNKKLNYGYLNDIEVNT